MNFKELSKQLRFAATILEDLKEVKPERKLPERYGDLPEDIIAAGYKSQIECNINIEYPMCALSSLYDLRKEYWDIANWEPNFKDSGQEKWGIYFKSEKPVIDDFYDCRTFLAFPTKEQAEHFLKHHRDLIERAKPLL